MSVSQPAMTNGIYTNLVFKWRAPLRAGLFDAVWQMMTILLPVVFTNAPVAMTSTTATTATAPATPASTLAAIKIVFADAVMRVHAGADAALLRTIFQSLRA